MKNRHSGKIGKKKALFAAGALLLLALPQFAQAEQTQSSVSQQIETFQSQLDTELAQVNKLYAKASDAQTQVQDKQAEINQLQGKIAQSEKDEQNLSNAVSSQMRSVQANGGVGTSVVDIIASSGNLSTMIQRLTSLNVVLSAESNQVKQLKDTQISLKNMKEKLVESKSQLVKNQATYQTQVKGLQGNISTLQTKISSNKQLLSEMEAQAAAAQKAREEKMAAEAAQAEKAKADQEAAAAAAKQAKAATAASSSATSASSSTTPSSSADTSSDSSKSSDNGGKTAIVPPAGNGKTLTVMATAYSWQNVGYMTATGIDLRKNPMCVAVDPSVIPLGTLLEVPGYGIAIAGDTGGAIIGHHIDVHVPTVAQAEAWGVKTVQIQLLS